MNDPSRGRLIGIARRPKSGAPIETISHGEIVLGGGLSGDSKGLKFRNRGITILAREDWQSALDDLAERAGAGPIDLDWTTRRANLLVEGVRLPRARGGILRIGPVLLEVTYPTQPCVKMERAHPGLLKALHPNWRGGVTCRVIEGGAIAVGDLIDVVHAPPEQSIRLPG